MFMHKLISVFTRFEYACGYVFHPTVSRLDRIQKSYCRVVQEIYRLFNIGSDAFLVQLRIHANLDLGGETVIFRTILQLCTNTHSVDVSMVVEIYTHTINQCGIKIENEKERRGEQSVFVERIKVEFFYYNTCKIRLQLVRKRLTISTRTFIQYIQTQSQDCGTGNPNETRPLSWPNFPCTKLPFLMISRLHTIFD